MQIGEKGYEWWNRLLVHGAGSETGENGWRIVLPKNRRGQAFKIGHAALKGGHF